MTNNERIVAIITNDDIAAVTPELLAAVTKAVEQPYGLRRVSDILQELQGFPVDPSRRAQVKAVALNVAKFGAAGVEAVIREFGS